MTGYKSPWVVALDFGTSSVRAMLFDERAEPVEGMEARREYSIPTRAGGAVEVEADLLLEAAWSCLDELLARAANLAGEISGVGVCTFVTNIMGLDADWKPVTPLALYSDTRSEPYVSKLRQALDEEEYHQRCGARFHTIYWPARLLWWAQAQPEVFRRVKHWMSLGDTLALRLFGRAVASTSSASWSGMQDRTRLEWDAPLLAALPVGIENLSPLVDVSQPLRGLRPEFARRWPALKDVPWLPAVGDGASANLGSGCTSAGQVAVTVGTTSAVRAVLDDGVPQVPPGLWCYRIDRRRSLLGGAMTEGGSLFAWIKQTLNWPAGTDFEEALTSVTPDGHGLSFLPLLGGERNPGWVASARGAISGLSFATTPADLLRAGLEAVTYRIALIYERLRQALPGEPEVVASGGAILHSPAWLQMLADVLGRPVRPARVAESSARGTARLALEVLGLSSEFSRATSDTVYLPDEGKHEIYRKARLRQESLYRKLVIDLA
jgi:gluconokinase